MSLEACHIARRARGRRGGHARISFDCAAEVGASGGALLDIAGSRLVAVFVGFRSIAPDRRMAFSPQNYNFAATVEGAFRRAVIHAAETQTAAR